MQEKQFIETYCHHCGTQRCEGIGTEWFEGCQYKWNLDGMNPAEEIQRLNNTILKLSSQIVKMQNETISSGALHCVVSTDNVREAKIAQLNFLAQTENENDAVANIAKRINNAKSDKAACEIADKYLRKIGAKKLSNITEIIALLLKGGIITRFTPDINTPEEEFYLLFIPVSDPPKQKTLIGQILPKHFDELYDKHIIMKKSPYHTDNNDRGYEDFEIARISY